MRLKVRLIGLAVVPFLFGAWPPRTAWGATPLETVRSVRLQGCHGHPGTRAPLRPNSLLGETARNVGRGASLRSAIAASGYREQESTLLHVDGDVAALEHALSGALCGAVTDAGFTDIGISQRGRETWIVFAAPFAPPTTTGADEVDSELLRRINLARAQPRRCGARWFAAVPPLQDSAQLRNAAEAHAHDMLEHNYFAHEGSDGTTPARRVSATGYQYRLVGENIASGPTTAQEAVEGWIASPSHCENLMEPRFTQSGVAFAASRSGAPRIVWVQEFAAPR